MKVFATIAVSMGLALVLMNNFGIAGKNDVGEKDLPVVKGIVEKAVNEILVILKNKKTPKAERKSKVLKIVDPLFNFELIAKLSLGRKHWNALDEKKRSEFTDLFSSQLKNSYLEQIDLLSDETVDINKPELKGTKVHVPTSIVAKEKRFEVIYKMYRNGEQWQVYDVEIEGVSVVKSFGLQYEQFLADNSIESLFEKMKSKVLGPPDALKKKSSKEGANKSAPSTTDTKNQG